MIFNAPAELSVRTDCHASSALAPASCRSPTDSSCSCATLDSRPRLGQELNLHKQLLAVVMKHIHPKIKVLSIDSAESFGWVYT